MGRYRMHPGYMKESVDGYDVQRRKKLFCWKTIRHFKNKDDALYYLATLIMGMEVDRSLIKQCLDPNHGVMMWDFKKQLEK